MKASPAIKERGFTLIELLVVIAIIGILSSVVLASLYVSRLKGADAAIKSNFHTIQSQMELDYANGNETYGGAVSQSNPATTVPAYSPAGTNFYVSDQTINNALKAALTQGGFVYYAVGVGGASYAVAAKLKGETGYWWCIDSSNVPKREPDANMTGTALGASSQKVMCP